MKFYLSNGLLVETFFSFFVISQGNEKDYREDQKIKLNIDLQQIIVTDF